MSKKLVKARVISDAPHLGLAVGMLVLALPGLVEALAKAQVVDPHPDAVQYAERNGAELVKLKSPEEQAAVAAQQARVTQLEQQLADAPDDAARATLAAELAAQQAKLADLG
jgi:hypothetical protein